MECHYQRFRMSSPRRFIGVMRGFQTAMRIMLFLRRTFQTCGNTSATIVRLAFLIHATANLSNDRKLSDQRVLNRFHNKGLHASTELTDACRLNTQKINQYDTYRNTKSRQCAENQHEEDTPRRQRPAIDLVEMEDRQNLAISQNRDAHCRCGERR